MSRLPSIAIARRAALAAVAVSVVVLAGALLEGVRPAQADGGAVYAGGQNLGSQYLGGESGVLPLESDSGAGLDGVGGGESRDGIGYLAPGRPPVHWGPSTPVVDFCTQQANRPPSTSAERFRATVAEAAAVWNAAEAAVGIRYTGDCANAGPWRGRNGVNEVAWDDDRDDVSGSQTAITEGRWFDLGARVEFAETDIVLSKRLSLPDRCLNFVVRHEMGHALGFGHSEWQGDLMYASFSSRLPSTCVETPSTREVGWLRALYGANRAPVIAPALVHSLLAGRAGELAIAAADPEHDRVTYTWRQTGGVPVALEGRGPIASVAAPAAGALMFTVEAVDAYLHRSSTSVTAVVVDPAAVPSGASELVSVHLGSGEARTVLEWSGVPGATGYRVCHTAAGDGGRACRDVTAPTITMDWPVTLDPGDGAAAAARHEAHAVTIAACNGYGCAPATAPVFLGGARSSSGDADFDVVALAVDAGGAAFTMGGVLNVGGPPRHVALYAGTPDEPFLVLLRDCGVLAARASCLATVAGGEARALPVVTATSTRVDPLTGERSTVRYPVRVR